MLYPELNAGLLERTCRSVHMHKDVCTCPDRNSYMHASRKATHTHTRRGSSVFGIENVFHLTAAPAPAHPCDSAETASLWYPFTATPAKHALPEKQRLVCVFVVYYTLFSRSLSGLCVCVVCGQVFVNEALPDQKCLWETTQWGGGWGVFSF